MIPNYKTIDRIVWWIPIRKIRDSVRNYLIKILIENNPDKLLKKVSTADVRDIHFLSDLKYDYYDYIGFNDLNVGNRMYSSGYCLKDYCGFDQKYELKVAIEHGMRENGMLYPEMTAPLPAYFKAGSLGDEHIREISNKKIYHIGPYIHYACEYLSEEKKKKEKKRLGKNLLVIPIHSCATHVITEYDITAFIKEIKKVAKDFDSVRICLYWSDILMGLDKVYKEAGLECVTAGHAYDIHFLSRLKSIINLSSLVMSNGFSTPTIYSVYMKKPFYLLEQEMNCINKIECPDTKKNVDTVLKLLKESKFRDLMHNTFNKYSETITKEQYDLLEKYCGLSKVKSKSELIEIINKTEELYKQMMNDYANKERYI